MIFPVSKMVFVPAAILFAAALVVPATAEEATENTDSKIPAVEKFSGALTDYFSISAESREAATRIANLAREVETHFLKTPRLWKNLLPPSGARVNVEFFAQPEIFRLVKDADGVTTLFVGENSSEALRTLLAHALILKISPGETAADIPAWLVCAVAEESRIGSIPGRRIFFRKKSENLPPRTPCEILSAAAKTLDADEVLRRNAVWFYRALPDVLIFLNTKKSVEEKLVAAFPKIFENKKFDAVIAEKFWAVRFREMIADTPAGMDLPDESRRIFDDALLFLVEKNGRETRVLACDLVEFRLRAEIRESVTDRLAAFAAKFSTVNPVWHNAFAEYGLFLEMFGNPDVDDETLAAQWDKAVLAREDALALRRDLRHALEQ